MAALLPANPGQALWIGGAGGKNHYNVGIGLGTSGGNNHEDFGQDLIEEGFVYSIADGTSPYNEADKFYLNSDGNCVFRINAGAGRTSNNTSHPRSELRELTASGAQAAWDGRSGLHYLRARVRITEVTSNRPWVCFGQIHGSPNSPETSDLVRLQCEGDDGTTTNMSLICRRSPPTGGSEIRTVMRTGYDLNDWFTYEIRMDAGRLIIFIDGAEVLNVTGMAQNFNYFKAGCYLQDNVEKGASATDFAAVEFERGSLVTWHTGYPQPTTPIFTGASDPGGGPGGGDGTPDTQAPTVPEDLVSIQDDQKVTLLWTPSTDNVGVSHYNVYRYSDTGGGGGSGSTATVGRTAGGASETASSTDKLVVSKATADADGTLTEGHFRARLSSAGSTTSKMFVYADSSGSPGALLATSDQITITDTAEGVRDYVFTGAQQISIVDGTDYWIGAAWDDPGTPSVTYSRDGTASRRHEVTITYPTAPDPFGTPTGTLTGPIDAWVDTVSSGVGGGAITTMGKITDGASNSVSSTDKVAASSVVAATNGTLISGVSRSWLSAPGTTGTRMVVYADTAGAPGNALAVSDEVTVTNTTEAAHNYTFSGVSQIAIASGTTYWVALAWDDPGTPSITISRDATAAGRQETTVFTYPPTVGHAFGVTSAQAGPLDAYVNVQAAAAGYVLLGTTPLATYVDTGLTNGTDYTYVVTAEDAAGNESGQSAAVTDSPGAPDTTAPTVPAGLSATAGDRKVSLSWTASTDADSGVAEYNVYRDSTLTATVTDTSYVDTSVTNGTSYTYTVSAVDVAGNESADSSAAAATPSGDAVAGVEILKGITLAVEIAWGADLGGDADDWVWTDVTADVRQDPGISCSLGRNDEASRSNPAQLTLTLRNDDGDYSQGGHSANWPYVRRNTPVRVRVDSDDGGGGRVLFMGLADGFTPGWDTRRGNLPVVNLSASGVLRRMAQGDAPVMSTYRRVMSQAPTVVAYWPFEEGKNATLASAVRGTIDMPLVATSGFSGPAVVGTPDWDSDDSFDSSAKLPRLKDGAFAAKVPVYTDTGANQVRFLLSIPENGLTDGTTIIHIQMSGSISQWGLTYEVVNGEEALGLFRQKNGAEHSNSIVGFGLNGTSGRFGLEIAQVGSDIQFRMQHLDAVTRVSGSLTATIAGETCGVVTQIEVNPHGHVGDLTFGHLAVENTINSGRTDSNALYAYRGEGITNNPGGRLSRLCIENNVPFTTHGGVAEPASDLSEMGPQLVAPLLELLEECEAADQGQLWDGRAYGLSYTTRKRREQGDVRLTIDAGAGELAGGFDPVDDDQRNLNKMQVTRLFGVTAEYEDDTGPLGTGAVGTYDSSATINTFVDEMAPQFAAWFVHLGTVQGYRYPSVTLDARTVPHLIPDILDAIPGERIDVTNLDDALHQFPTGTVSLIIEGIQHEISSSGWMITFRCSPFSPWGVGRVAAETGDTSDMLMRPDTDGSTLAVAAAKGATSLSVATTGTFVRWTTTADDFPFLLDVGGIPVRVTACSGSSSPQTFTCDPLPHKRDAGVPVQLWDPRPIGLG